MLINLSKHAPNHKVHFYCLDTEIYEFLTKAKFGKLDVTFELWNCDVSKYLEGYYSEKYMKITHQKMGILRDALQKYGWIHFIDSDVVCIHEPTPEFYDEYKNYDIVFQFDCGVDPSKDHFGDYRFNTWTCTGNMTLRNTEGTAYILNTIWRFQKLFPKKNDQECLLQYFDEFKITDIRQEENAALYVYPPDKYVNGNVFMNSGYNTDSIYFLHANHVIGRDLKMDLLKKAKQWWISDDEDTAASKVESS